MCDNKINPRFSGWTMVKDTYKDPERASRLINFIREHISEEHFNEIREAYSMYGRGWVKHESEIRMPDGTWKKVYHYPDEDEEHPFWDDEHVEIVCDMIDDMTALIDEHCPDGITFSRHWSGACLGFWFSYEFE